MLEAFECLGNIAGHGEVNGARLVVPGKCKSNIECACPVCCDELFVFQNSHQVLCMFFSHILYSEVINTQGEGDWTGLVFVESGCVCVTG
jgi:hypothetical protein